MMGRPVESKSKLKPIRAWRQQPTAGYDEQD